MAAATPVASAAEAFGYQCPVCKDDMDLEQWTHADERDIWMVCCGARTCNLCLVSWSEKRSELDAAITNIQRKLDSVISLLSLAQKQSSAHKVEGGCQVDRFFC